MEFCRTANCRVDIFNSFSFLQLTHLIELMIKMSRVCYTQSCGLLNFVLTIYTAVTRHFPLGRVRHIPCSSAKVRQSLGHSQVFPVSWKSPRTAFRGFERSTPTERRGLSISAPESEKCFEKKVPTYSYPMDITRILLLFLTIKVNLH